MFADVYVGGNVAPGADNRTNTYFSAVMYGN